MSIEVPDFLSESITESPPKILLCDIRSDEDIRRLNVGTVIEIDGLKQFARVADIIARRILLVEASDDVGEINQRVRTNLPEVLRGRQRSGGYWGDNKTENHSAIIIPTDRSVMHKKVRDSDDMIAMSFLAVRDIVSTKGGNRGPASTTCTVYGRPKYSTFMGGTRVLFGDFTVAVRPADHTTITTLLRESQESRFRQLAHAIRFAYRGGIPGGGKDR